MSGTHEHLEHAEHAEHAHNPFDKRVAVTIAMVAAILAGVAMLGHRKHNEVITLKAESTELEVKASNGWAWYQATKARQQEYQLDATLAVMMSAKKPSAKSAEMVEKLTAKLAELKSLPPSKADDGLKKIMKEFGEIEKELRAGLEPWQQLQVTIWREKVREYDVDLANRKKLAEQEGDHAHEKRELAEYRHHQAEWLDYAHLAVELGIVLCSIAVLTKRKVFWVAGIASSIIGLAVVAYAFNLPHHHPEHHAEAPQEQKGEEKVPAKTSTGQGH